MRYVLPLVLLAACGSPTLPVTQNPSTTPTNQTPTPTGPTGPSGDPKPQETPPVDYFIVSATALKPSAEKWAGYREQQGMRVRYATVKEIAEDASTKIAVVDAIQARIKKEATKEGAGKPFFVLLLGDADGTKIGDKIIPDGKYSDSAGVVSSDNVYADLNDDDLPDLAIGRVAVNNTTDADIVLSKTISYESDYNAGEWNRRASVFASEAGFGAAIDQQIENLVFKIVEDLPYDYDFSMTYAKQASPYVWVPELFSDKVYDRMNEGALMVTYVGHGSTDAFTNLTWNTKAFPIMDTTKLAKLNVQNRPPILTFIACLTGGFAGGDSLSERIVRQVGAPVAVLSSTEVSNPVPNAIFVRELGQAVLAEKKLTLGEAFMRAKERLIKQKDPLRSEISQMATLMYTVKAQEAMNLSHLHMYTLFGDPALRIGRPQAKVTLTSPANVKKGTNLSVTVAIEGLTGPGDAVVTLEAKRSAIVGTLAAVPADGNASRNNVITSNYAIANNKRVVTSSIAQNGGGFGTVLAVPAGTTPGSYVVKVYVRSGEVDGITSAPITVDP